MDQQNRHRPQALLSTTAPNSITEPESFGDEQKSLVHTWTFLGVVSDLERDGDWFKASIATRSVFVQRFGKDLKGFENRCAHRGYPLRHEDRGTGPIVCGYHHWHYDREGQTVGIPLAKELFDALPQEMGVRLNPIELATCGDFIFGRFPTPRAATSLEEFLGEGFPILAALSRTRSKPQFLTRTVKANVRLCLHITLDDYHAVAVHPRTLGRGGYVRPKDISYIRFGAHSAFLNTKRPEAFERMAAKCQSGGFQPTHYSIFHILPNLVVVLCRVYSSTFQCLIESYQAAEHNRTVVRSWLYPAPFPSRQQLASWLVRPIVAIVARLFIERVFREDDLVSERMQSVAHQINSPPVLAKTEERIGWFDESYTRLVAEGKAIHAPGDPVC